MPRKGSWHRSAHIVILFMKTQRREGGRRLLGRGGAGRGRGKGEVGGEEEEGAEL